MKILGIGIDIVENIRIHKSLKNVNYYAPFVTKSETVINSIKKYLESKS